MKVCVEHFVLKHSVQSVYTQNTGKIFNGTMQRI